MGCHVFLCRSLLLSTTVLNDNTEFYINILTNRVNLVSTLPVE